MPWSELTDAEKQFVIEGGEDFDGIRGFFRWLERKKYKVHVRVFLSRYRGYLTCPDCGGARLRREARDVQRGGPHDRHVSALTVREAQSFFASLKLTEKEEAIAEKVLREIRRRLSFLSDVGLDYLTPRSVVVNAVGRRSAADQSRHLARFGAGRHACTSSTSRRSVCTRATICG